MAVIIGQAGLDEHGNITGGQAGDQGHEVDTRDWWSMGWTQCVRPKTEALANKIAANMEAACKNNYIGYDQNERLSLFRAAQKVDFNISRITTPCECDCSSLVAVCVIASGVSVNPELYTGNEVNALKNTGKFDVLSDRKYLDSSDYLKRGDILVKQYSHTVIVLTDGAKIEKPVPVPDQDSDVMYADCFDKAIAGAYKVSGMGDMYMRRGAGTGYKVVTVVPDNAVVHNYGYYSMYKNTKWLYCLYNGKTGFISSNGLKRA